MQAATLHFSLEKQIRSREVQGSARHSFPPTPYMFTAPSAKSLCDLGIKYTPHSHLQPLFKILGSLCLGLSWLLVGVCIQCPGQCFSMLQRETFQFQRFIQSFKATGPLITLYYGFIQKTFQVKKIIYYVCDTAL